MNDKTFWALLAGMIIGGIVVGLFLSRPSYGYYATPASSQKTFYTNTEEWEIVKDARGRTKGVRVKRTAKEG